MSNPIRQHIVPQSYLKNFSNKKKNQYKIYALSKNKKNNIFEVNIANISLELNYYTVNKLEDKFAWEKFYAEKVEPSMSITIQKLIKLSNIIIIENFSQILSFDLKVNLSFIMIIQMLRGNHTRDYQRKVFEDISPKVVNDTKEAFYGKGDPIIDNILDNFQISNDLFKLAIMYTSINMKSISNYANTLLQKTWVLFKITDDEFFITSDEPVLIMNKDSLDSTPFKHGISNNTTVIFYPISPKLMIALYSPNMLSGFMKYNDNSLIYIDKKEKIFINLINNNQLEHCYRHVYSNDRPSLENLK